MTHHTSTRLRTAGLTALASVADHLAAAARRASAERDRRGTHDQERDALLRKLEQMVHNRNLALNTIVDQLGALTRGEQPAPWPEATGDEVVDTAVAAVSRLAADMQDRQAALVSVLVSLAQRWQTTANEMEYRARQTLKRYPDDPDSLQDYYGISHLAAMQARAAQSVVVLAGRKPLRQFQEPQPLAKVVQHAASQIVDYPRVLVTSNPDVAVVSTLALQLIHLVAELLENATRSAPDSTPVTVTFDKVDPGWAITVHDDGHGLDDRLQWAQDRVSGRVPVGLHELGESPETGLAVVGKYAQDCGFLVHLDRAANGGVRAVTTVPQHLLVPVSPPADVAVAPAPRQPARTTPPQQAALGKHHDPGPAFTPAEPPGGRTAHGLPIRVPKQDDPLTPRRTSAPPPAPAPDPDKERDFMTTFVEGSLPVSPPAPANDTPAAATEGEESR